MGEEARVCIDQEAVDWTDVRFLSGATASLSSGVFQTVTLLDKPVVAPCADHLSNTYTFEIQSGLPARAPREFDL